MTSTVVVVVMLADYLPEMTDVINLMFMHKFEDRQINKLNHPLENRVMLDDYLPEMQRMHLIKLIIMVGIVNFSARIHRQVFLSVCFNEIDRPTSEADQGIVCY